MSGCHLPRRMGSPRFYAFSRLPVRSSRSFRNLDCVSFDVEKFKVAGALPILLDRTGANAAGNQFVPDLVDFAGKQYRSGPEGCGILRNENNGVSILVELKSDAILSRLFGGGEFPQAELFRVPGRSDGNVSYCNISSLGHSQPGSHGTRWLDTTFEEIAPLHPREPRRRSPVGYQKRGTPWSRNTLSKRKRGNSP